MTADVLPRHGHILLIGGQRCGTTWLQNLLAGHRDIRLPLVARPEPKFFLDDVDHGRYDELFPQVGGSWLLDKSTTYLERGDAAGRAAQCVPDAWVVVILRDPVARAYSNWSFSTVNGLEDLPAESALTEEAEGRGWTGLSTSPYHYLRRSRYAALLEPWQQAFGDRVIVIQHERAIADSGPSYVEQRLAPIGLEPAVGWVTPPEPANVSAGLAPIDPALQTRLAACFRDDSSRLAPFGIDRTLWTVSE